MLGTINPADLMTKYLTAEVNEGHCQRLGLHFKIGRAGSAPTLSHLMEGHATWEVKDQDRKDDDGSEDEGERVMQARFQATLNQLWKDKWRKIARSQVVLACEAIETGSSKQPRPQSKEQTRYSEDEQGLLQPMLGGLFSKCDTYQGNLVRTVQSQQRAITRASKNPERRKGLAKSAGLHPAVLAGSKNCMQRHLPTESFPTQQVHKHADDTSPRDTMSGEVEHVAEEERVQCAKSSGGIQVREQLEPSIDIIPTLKYTLQEPYECVYNQRVATWQYGHGSLLPTGQISILANKEFLVLNEMSDAKISASAMGRFIRYRLSSAFLHVTVGSCGLNSMGVKSAGLHPAGLAAQRDTGVKQARLTLAGLSHPSRYGSEPSST